MSKFLTYTVVSNCENIYATVLWCRGHKILKNKTKMNETNLGPRDEFPNCQTFLLAGKAECETEWQNFILDLLIFHERSQARGDVVEQVAAGPLHDLLRDGVHLRVHFEPEICYQRFFDCVVV